jgi:CheY-like chemotaxis protein
VSLPVKDIIQFPARNRQDGENRRIPRILLVNDHADLRELLARILKKSGYTHIIEAADGNEAIKQLRLNPVDLLITDVHMPHIDGWRLARMVRSGLFSCLDTTPIIAVSATFGDRTRIWD